jgi:Type I restriction enzyme R protein N terminus (HSDR_N)
VDQFTVIEGQNNRRADIVVFVNGPPTAIIELKVPQNTDKWFAAAYNQIQTYKHQSKEFFANTAIHPICRTRRRSLSCNKPRFSAPNGQHKKTSILSDRCGDTDSPW